MKVKFHPEARVDLREGRAFYRKRSPIAAIAFSHAIDHGIDSIAEAPLRYAAADYGTREFVLPRRFPYTLVYKLKADSVVIVAVAHHSREPEYWRHRV